MVKISIIIPIYNRENHIIQCLNSLLQNSMKNDLEIIIVDDGSTDNSGIICDKYAKKFDFIKVIHQSNLGVATARNVGLKNATGEWIGWIDSDDMVRKNYLSSLLKYIKEGKYDVIIFGYNSFKKYSHKLLKAQEISELKDISKEKCMNLLGNIHVGNFLWNKLFKRKLFKEINFPNNRVYEDVATTYRVLYKANSIGYTDSKLYLYRENNNSIVHQHNNLKAAQMLRDRIKSQKELIQFLSVNYPKALKKEENILLTVAFEYIKEIEVNNLVNDKIYTYCEYYINNYHVDLNYDSKKVVLKVWTFKNFPKLYKLILKRKNK